MGSRTRCHVSYVLAIDGPAQGQKIDWTGSRKIAVGELLVYRTTVDAETCERHEYRVHEIGVVPGTYKDQDVRATFVRTLGRFPMPPSTDHLMHEASTAPPWRPAA